MQSISNNTYKKVIRIFGIAGHSKGEVDHVGGLVKCAIRREIANGAFLENANDMVLFLSQKFGEQNDPNYITKENDSKQLQILRNEARYTVFQQ